jgi:hypothetical protein
MSVVSREQSFVRFVYSFVFAPEHFAAVVTNLNAAQMPLREGRPAKVWETARFPEADLLPHVARYLNAPDEKDSTVKIWKLGNDVWNSFEGFGSKADWTLHVTQSDDQGVSRKLEIAFEFKEIELSLFRTGVGFVTVEAAPKSDVLADWHNFIHFFRFVDRKTVTLAGERKVGRTDSEPFFPPFAVANGDRQNLKQIICALLTVAGTNCDEVFIPDQLLPYVSLFIKDSVVADDYDLIYKTRNFFHSEQGKTPAPNDLDAHHPTLLEYARRQWQIFTLDGSSFVAFDAPDTDFFRNTLPSHLRHQYFLLFLLALQQRFALTNFSSRVSEYWLMRDDDRRAAMFERIRQDFFDFTARGYFIQVMQREHHHRCYVRWQEKFQVERFFCEVREKVREMNDYLQSERSRRIEQLAAEQKVLAEEQKEEAQNREQRQKEEAEKLARQHENRIALIGLLLALTFGIPSLVVSFLGINLNKISVKENEGMELSEALYIALGTWFACLLISGIIFLIYQAKERKN